jgi:hypothetical protein
MKKPFKETKVGQFLQSKGFDKALDLVGTFVPGVDLLSDVKDLVLGDKAEVKLTPEEQALFLELYQADLQEFQLEIQDRENARNREIQINQSEHSSWLAKNIGPLIAIVYVSFSMVLYILVLSGTLKASDNIANQVITLVGSVVMLIVGYFFGSSRNSAEKDKTIRNLTKQ